VKLVHLVGFIIKKNMLRFLSTIQCCYWDQTIWCYCHPVTL